MHSCTTCTTIPIVSAANSRVGTRMRVYIYVYMYIGLLPVRVRCSLGVSFQCSVHACCNGELNECVAGTTASKHKLNGLPNYCNFTSCLEYSAQYTCHWCRDSCHVLGSGCAWAAHAHRRPPRWTHACAPDLSGLEQDRLHFRSFLGRSLLDLRSWDAVLAWASHATPFAWGTAQARDLAQAVVHICLAEPKVPRVRS